MNEKQGSAPGRGRPARKKVVKKIDLRLPEELYAGIADQLERYERLRTCKEQVAYRQRLLRTAQQFTDVGLAKELDQLLGQSGEINRSEFIRLVLRTGLTTLESLHAKCQNRNE
ncbi:MAG: hypothetical protein C0622_01655 [Desulfuromonas sp.]|nr:MAG: hypothetical protein C0622_01655 [Desulfuromonas sp.]